MCVCVCVCVLCFLTGASSRGFVCAFDRHKVFRPRLLQLVQRLKLEHHKQVCVCGGGVGVCVCVRGVGVCVEMHLVV